jgi:serine/threonine protein kinase
MTNKSHDEETTVIVAFAPKAAAVCELGMHPSIEGSVAESGALPTFHEVLRANGADEEAAEVPERLRLGDFELLRELGRGSLARVFLARQVSLNRQVALKVSSYRGNEALTLASLEHDHIVRVFSQTLDPQRSLRLLCMQYVPGTTLEQVIRQLGQRSPQSWSGQSILDIVAAPGGQTTVDATAPRDRQLLDSCDFVEAVCSLGARLADALAHAHGRGVLHRDIKPANILINHHGRPLLSDFNLAFIAGNATEELFGGTLRYMAPEHLDAFNSDTTTPPEAVDERSDLYSLGVVLFELLTGQPPFADSAENLPREEALHAMAAERRGGAPSPRQRNPEVSEVLDRVVRRCLAPEPGRRYSSAAELAQVLDGCRELRHMAREMPPAGLLTKASRRHPQIWALVLPLLPHILGAFVVFSYSALWAAGHPNKNQLERAFLLLGIAYSVVVFPLTGGLAYSILRPIWRTILHLRGPDIVDRARVLAMRRRALRKPFWGLLLSMLGWLPGALLLPPLLLCLVPESAGWELYLHYALSYLIAGLIALTYTEFADQFLVLCVAYPNLWVDPRSPQQTARLELGPVFRRLRVFQNLSVLIPLATGIALMVGLIAASPERRASSSYQMFLLLVTVLMVLGMAGSWVAGQINSRLNQTLVALTGSERQPQ